MTEQQRRQRDKFTLSLFSSSPMTKIKKSLHTELGHLNLGDMAFLELTGRIPTPQESVGGPRQD